MKTTTDYSTETRTMILAYLRQTTDPRHTSATLIATALADQGRNRGHVVRQLDEMADLGVVKFAGSALRHYAIAKGTADTAAGITISRELARQIVDMLSHLELISGDLDAGIAACEIRGLIAPDVEAPEPAWSPKNDYESEPDYHDYEGSRPSAHVEAAEDDGWLEAGLPVVNMAAASGPGWRSSATKIARELILD